jgi:LuxR family transcriptional regulator, maltose regulon positive regulatory protein
MVLQRQRLHALIAARLPGAVWLHGPTGAGKTVLLRSYLLHEQSASIWLTADERHRDPAALFAALSAVAAPFCNGPLPSFSPEHRDEPAAFARGYFARLDQLLPDEHALVVDDVHHLTGATAPLLAMAIDGFNGKRNLCFASQLLPDAAFAPQLAGSRLWVVGHKLLAFDESEAHELAQRLGADVPPLEALVQATDGWAAGLMLAMQLGAGNGPNGGSNDPLESVRTPLALLIAGQVLGGVAKDDLVKLRLFAVLPQVPMELADIAPAWASACARLQNLSERGLFVERLAADRARPVGSIEHTAKVARIRRVPKGCWRLHDLFRNALNEPGAIGMPDRVVGAELIEMLLTIERLDLAWQLAAVLGVDALQSVVASHGGEALRDPQLLPMAQFAISHADRKNPSLAIWLARALLGNDNAASLDACEEAFWGYQEINDDEGMALATSLALFIVFSTIENVSAMPRWTERMTNVSRASLANLEDGEERAFRLAGEVVHDLIAPGRAPSSDEAALEQDRLLGEVLGHTFSPNESILAGSLLVVSMKRLNRLSEVEKVIVLIEGLASFSRSAPHMRATWKIENGYHFHRTGAIDHSRKSFTEALGLADDNALMQAKVRTLIGLVRLELLAGDLNASRLFLERIDEIGAERLGRLNGWAVHLRARYELSLGHANRALSLLTTAEQLIRDAGFPDSATILIDLDRLQVLYALQKWNECGPVIDRIRRTDNETDLQHGEVLFGLLEAHSIWDTQRQQAEEQLQVCMKKAIGLDLTLFVLLLPAVAGEIASHALELGVDAEFLCAAIRMRNLPAPTNASLLWPWPLRIELLGTFRFFRSGAPIQSSGKAQQKPLELLKYLSCAREMVADFNSLTDALWPDAETAAARKNLEVTVSRLRKLLEDDTLVLVKEGKVALDSARVSSDAIEFGRLAVQAEALIAKGQSKAQVIDLGERLLHLFQGLPLENEEPTAWREALREKYRSAFIRAVRSLSSFWSEANDLKRAIPLLETAVAREPLAETLYQTLMRIYIKENQSAEAMRVYRQCKQMLSILIGQAPSSETEQIRNLIKS